MPAPPQSSRERLEPPEVISPAQWRMARAGLNLTVRQLGRLANVGTTIVRRLEAGEAVVPWTVKDIRMTLEAAGVEFISQNGGGPGVRLRVCGHDLPTGLPPKTPLFTTGSK